MGNQIRSTGPPWFSRKKEQRDLGVKEVIENNRMRAWGGVKKKCSGEKDQKCLCECVVVRVHCPLTAGAKKSLMV